MPSSSTTSAPKRTVARHRAVQHAPHFYGRSSLAQGKFERAAQLFERAFELNPADFVSMGQLVMALRRLGREHEKEHAYRRLLAAARKHLEPTPEIGNVDRAIELLDRSVTLDYGNRAWLDQDSHLDPLRADPRFQVIVSRLPG